jgi:bifunctional non-homologous end joining protein LigD
LTKLRDPVRKAPRFDASLADLVAAVRAQWLEGLVAKSLDSRYEPGQRSGAWRKMRLNRAQEFVIGGYTKGGSTFDALVFGYYERDRLLCAARTRNGFSPAARARLMKPFAPFVIGECPFANPPECPKRSLGPGPHRRQNEGLRVAEAGPGGSV